MVLHYKNRQYQLALFDDFYITTVKPSKSGAIESILNALQESTRVDSFMSKTGIQFTVTNTGVLVNPKDVISLI
jgi:hypothetical protein